METSANSSAEELRVLERTRRVGEEAVGLADALGEAIADWQAFLRLQLRDRPYTTLGAAAGVGYVLGGGLPPRVMRLAVTVAGRVAVAVLIRDLVEARDRARGNRAAESRNSRGPGESERSE